MSGRVCGVCVCVCGGGINLCGVHIVHICIASRQDLSCIT